MWIYKNEARYSKRNRDHSIGSEVFHFGVRSLQTAEVNCRPHWQPNAAEITKGEPLVNQTLTVNWMQTKTVNKMRCTGLQIECSLLLKHLILKFLVLIAPDNFDLVCSWALEYYGDFSSHEALWFFHMPLLALPLSHQYAYSPYCSLYISWGAVKEKMFHNQKHLSWCSFLVFLWP